MARDQERFGVNRHVEIASSSAGLLRRYRHFTRTLFSREHETSVSTEKNEEMRATLKLQEIEINTTLEDVATPALAFALTEVELMVRSGCGGASERACVVGLPTAFGK